MRGSPESVFAEILFLVDAAGFVDQVREDVSSGGVFAMAPRKYHVNG